jgi:parallel beta-helix repeat protein
MRHGADRTARAALLVALTLVLALPANAGAATFGKTTVGASAGPGGGFSANVKRCAKYTLSETGDVSKLTLYTGGAPGFSGTQAIRAVIYATSSGVPTTRLAVSNERVVSATETMAWRDLVLPTTVRLTPGTYCLGVHSGTTEGVADYRWDAVAGSWHKNADTYSDGASSPFGTAETGNQQISVYATYTPVSVCSKWASTTGSDANPGTSASPYRTVQKLVDNITSGQTGCLKTGGTFVQKFKISGSGITLRTDPASSGRASIRGRMEVTDTANDVRVENVFFNVTNRDLGLEVGMQIWGDRFRLVNSEVTASSPADAGSCILLGSHTYGIANDPVIERNRIHDCGTNWPAHDHAIYLEAPRRAIVRNNYIYDNDGGWGLHFYPDADSSTIENNTLDGNWSGITISGEGTRASDGNTLRNNIVSNSYGRYNVESYWSGAVPTGNAFNGVCVWNPAPGFTNFDGGRGTAYTVTGEIVADPLYVNRGAKDFRLQTGSPCAGKGVQ